MQPAPSFDSREILGMRVDATNYADATNRVLRWALAGQSRYVCISNSHAVVESHDDPNFRRLMNAADMVTPDGMPLVWLLRRKGVAAQRVYGPDLMLHILKAAAREGVPVGFYGSTEAVLETLRSSLRARMPALEVAFSESPPFRPLEAREDACVVRRINASGARILFLGLGCPKQERWMADHRGRIGSVMIGVGAAFDFLAGLKPQAPGWMQSSGLEWFFRLITEPRRLARRYAHNVPVFLALAASDWAREVSAGLRVVAPAAAGPAGTAEPPRAPAAPRRKPASRQLRRTSLSARPLISVVMPSFNQRDYIEEAMDSILSQGYPHRELIVIDGGSTDGTADVLRRYSRHLAFWCSEADAGQSDAINKGLRRSTGELIGWQNSDDKYYPYAFEEAVETLHETRADVVFGNIHHIDSEGRILREVKFTPFRRFTMLYDNTGLANQGAFWTRELQRATGPFDLDVDLTMDFDFFLRASACGGRFVHRNSFWAAQRIHSGAKTVVSEQHVMQEIYASIDRHFPGARTSPGKVAALAALSHLIRAVDYVRQGDLRYVGALLQTRLASRSGRAA